jgi:hypothetical protein
MSAPGRRRGAGPRAGFCLSAPPSSRGTLTRGLLIGRCSWRTRIGPHHTGADPSSQWRRAGCRLGGAPAAPSSSPGNGRRAGRVGGGRALRRSSPRVACRPAMRPPPRAALGLLLLLLLLLPPDAARKPIPCQRCRELVDKFNKVGRPGGAGDWGQQARPGKRGRGWQGRPQSPGARRAAKRCHLLRRGWPTRPRRTSAVATRPGRRRRCPSTSSGGRPVLRGPGSPGACAGPLTLAISASGSMHTVSWTLTGPCLLHWPHTF